MESIHTLASNLFSGKVQHPCVYQDAHLVEFCERYFQRQLGPHLLGLLDTIYHAIPADQRLRWEQGVIVVTHMPRENEEEEEEQCADEGAGAAGTADALSPSEASTNPIGTGFFCLARSTTATHSRAVHSFLQTAHQAGATALPADTATQLLALAPFAPPEAMQRVDATTLLLGWEADFAPDAGREAATACTAAGCHVLAPALWLESGEVLYLHGLGPGEPWRFSRAHGSETPHGDCAQVFETSELLALLLAMAG